MKIVGAGLIDKAKRRHGDLDGPLSAWLKITEEQAWTSLNDIRSTFPHTDCVEGKYIFNIKGNGYRLTATLNFRSQLLVIERIMTHAEYDKGGWK